MTIQDVSAATDTTMTAAQAAKIASGAKEFESMMLEQMLKPLNFGGDQDGGEATGAAGTVQGFATEAIAKGISAGGGLGFARQITRQVMAEHHGRKAAE